MGSSGPDLTSRILRRERFVVAGGIILLAAISWWFLASGAGMDGHMDMPGMRPPLTALVLMWWLMMVAMMLPSAAPAILLYARVRQQRRSQPALPDTGVFLAGYLLVWLLFSIVAATAQALLIGASMALDNPFAQGALLIAAGIYQLTPLKQACLRQCQSPAQFISRHWRSGVAGAVRLGGLHGAYCVGCCWMLMALLFVGGVMNFAWIAGLTLLVGAEKLLPRGEWLARVSGAVLIAWGLLKLAGWSAP
jgi:predicted metal-binding membrane protein